MGRPPKKKKAIERAALELFAETGIDGASIRMIAERAQVTEGALYRHHASKDDLVRSLFFDYFERFARLLKSAGSSTGSIDQRIRAMVEGFLKAYDEDPQGFHFVLVVQHSLLEDVRRDMANPVDTVVEVLRDAVARKEIPRQDLPLAAQFMMGIVMQTAVAHRYGRIKGPLASKAADVSAACLRVIQWPGAVAAGKGKAAK